MPKIIGSSGEGFEPSTENENSPISADPGSTPEEEFLSQRKAPADSLQIKEGKFFQALGAGLQTLSKLTAPSTRRSSTRNVTAPRGGGKATALFSLVVNRPDPLFCALSYTGKSNQWGGERYNARNRIAVVERLLSSNPGLSFHDRTSEGETLAHAIIGNPSLKGEEQATLLYFLRDHGVDFNLCDSDGINPLELALGFAEQEIEPLAIRALQEGGARYALGERIPIIGHLVGGWGHVELETLEGTEKIRLEGLTPLRAEYGLDPVFKDAITQVREESSEEMAHVLDGALSAWDDNRNMRPLLEQIRSYGLGEEFQRGPKMVTTGWVLPAGHAVGLVGNEEEDGYYLYACNTGLSADSKRCIVRYEVTDPAVTYDFLLSCAHNRDQIRTLFVEGGEDKGLTRCDSEDQLPREMEKAVQKRSNCPLACRKAALVASMWSCGQRSALSSRDLRETYKKITTLIREHGVREALDVGEPALMGKALVKMLTKADRPACQGLAWELTRALKTHYHPDEAGDLAPEPPPITSELFISTVGQVLTLTGLSPNHIFTTGGRTLAQHARHQGNLVAADLLDHYSKPMDRVKKLFRFEYWDSLLN